VTLTGLWVFLAVALPVLGALLAPLSAVDLAYHLRAGGQFLDTGVVPSTDTLTFTAQGQPWLNQQWGAQALLAAVYRIAGWTGLAVVRAALVGSVAALVFATVRRQGIPVRPAAWLTLAAFVLASVAMALRPQLIGMALFALVLLLVVERHRRPRLLWAIPVVTLAWANIHGSFFLAPAALGLAWLADVHDRRPNHARLLVVAVVCAVAACVNPFGPAVWLYAAGLSTNPTVTELATEWQPTSLRSPAGIAFFASVLVLAAALARRGRATPWPALLWFGFFFLIGAWAVRGAAWWPIGAAVGVAGLLGTGFLGSGEPLPAEPARREPVRRLNLVLVGALAVAGLALLPVWRPVEPATGTPAGLVAQAPPGVTRALRDTATEGDRIFLPQLWGSWVEFAVPQATVVVDSRFELFPDDVWQRYLQVAAGRPAWAQQLDDWGVTLVVATTEHMPTLLEHLESAQGWREIHRDAEGVVFERV
jgi:hypothetical protein